MVGVQPVNSHPFLLHLSLILCIWSCICMFASSYVLGFILSCGSFSSHVFKFLFSCFDQYAITNIILERDHVAVIKSLSFLLPDSSFITTWPFLWKVSAITLVSCLPLYIIKYLKRKFSPPSYSKLSS